MLGCLGECLEAQCSTRLGWDGSPRLELTDKGSSTERASAAPAADIPIQISIPTSSLKWFTIMLKFPSLACSLVLCTEDQGQFGVVGRSEARVRTKKF